MRKEIQEDIAYTFDRSYYVLGVKQVPDYGTDNSYAIVYDNGGNEAQEATQLDIASDGTMSFSFTAANNTEDDKNFKIEWVFTVNNTAIYEYQLFDVVKCPIVNVTRDEDLFTYMPDLRNDIKELFGETTSAGSTTTLISTRLTADKRNWTGGFVEIYVDETVVHEGQISSYASSTGTVTFTPAYSIAIATSLKFRIRTSYQTFINQAFSMHVWRDLRNKQKIASGYIDGDVVRSLTVQKTIQIIAYGKREAPDDTWDLRYKDAKDEYNTQLQKFLEPYDTDEDGNISEQENLERPNMTGIDMHR